MPKDVKRKERKKMGYFGNCECIEDLKKKYRELCMMYHPDISKIPNAGEIMKMINNEYDQLFSRLKNIFRDADGEIYENTKSASANESPEEFRNIIITLATLDGITIELIGRWIWVTGDTKKWKDTLKGLNFRWCRNKKSWSWHRPGDFCHSRKNSNLDDIRAKYGSTKYTNQNQKEKVKEIAC